MTHQTNAQRLADALQRDMDMNWPDFDNGDAIVAELRRLSAIEQERDQLRDDVSEQARLNGMGAERELALMAERDSLRSQLAALKDGQAGGEVVAYLYQCRKKPQLKELRFNKRCLALESMGYKAHALTLATPKPVPMTDEQIRAIGKQFFPKTILTAAWFGFARAIEAHHGISEVQG